MISLVKRNIKVFFRDRTSVFFSLLSVIIVILLYALFLGKSLKSSVQNISHVDFLMDSWVMAGMITVTSVTSTLGAFGVMVMDNNRKISKDFYSSPLKRGEIVASYILSSCFVGFIMSIVNFILAEIYIISSGGEILDIKKWKRYQQFSEYIDFNCYYYRFLWIICHQHEKEKGVLKDCSRVIIKLQPCF